MLLAKLSPAFVGHCRVDTFGFLTDVDTHLLSSFDCPACQRLEGEYAAIHAAISTNPSREGFPLVLWALNHRNQSLSLSC